jgi:hypothetical protein
MFDFIETGHDAQAIHDVTLEYLRRNADPGMEFSWRSPGLWKIASPADPV